MTNEHRDTPRAEALTDGPPDPLKIVQFSLAEIHRISRPTRAAIEADDKEAAAELQLKAIINRAGSRQALLLDDASRYALISIAHDLHAMRTLIGQLVTAPEDDR